MGTNCRLSAVVCLVTLVVAPVARAIAPGDLNDDGFWDARDALLLEQYLRGERTLTAAQLEAADVAPLGITVTTAGNGAVDAGDLVVLLRLLADDDVDGDHLSAEFEAAHGFSPFVTDEDGNGIPDGLDDDDQDGLINVDEERVGFDPRDPDSDSDGIIDSLELAPAANRAVATNVSSSTQFLFDEEGSVTPLQLEAEAGEIDPLLLAVLRGTVRTRTGEPVPGARVSILGRPEFGSTTTRVDGMFDLVVNGGATLTVVYDHPGFLAVQRKVKVPWQDYVFLPDVVLIPLDPVYTDVDLAQLPAIQVAQGSVSTDASGSRQVTLLFRQGTIATAVLPDDTTAPLSQIRVRATEYTIGEMGPEAMPGELPPQSAYTYAVEFTVDEARALGAKGVSFELPGAPSPIDQYPVSAYLQDFLDVPVGTPIPNGHYDHEKGAWLPERSGVALRIVAVANGRAELDLTGDGIADDTEEIGISDEERDVLAGLYAVDQVLWWVPLAHFSDFNFAPRLQEGTEPPPIPVPNGQVPPRESEACHNSTIRCESQALMESVPITDTPFLLSYASDRTPGYAAAYTLRFPLRSASPLPAEVLRVGLEVSIAGRRYEFEYTPAEVNSDPEEQIVWDGTDGYGRILQGRQPVTALLRYDYGFGYQSTSVFGRAGDGSTIEGAQTRTRFTVRQPWFGFVGAWDARGAGLGGWTLDPHHTYDPYSRVLYTGDGRQRRAEQLPDVIETAAGGGTVTSVPPEGIRATDFKFESWLFDHPQAITVGPDGSVFVAHGGGWGARISRIDRSGMMKRFACGGSDLTSNGIAATSARCSEIGGLVVAPDGAVYLSLPTSRRVRKVTPDGRIWTVAGTGDNDFNEGDTPLLATDANLGAPRGLALATDGSLFIADGLHSRVRRVDPRGYISTVAGSGSGSSVSGENGPATAAVIDVRGVALDAEGNLYITSSTRRRVWKVTPDGILRRFAGTGGAGPLGDGGPAIDASLVVPQRVAVGPDGSVYISTNSNQPGQQHRIRRVSPSGMISTVAGTGPEGSSGDGGPAAAALLSPADLAIAPDGTLYVVDNVGLRVRRIRPAFPGAAAGTLSITSPDGSERYEFDSSGKHLATHETVGNTLLYTFAYDAEDRLASITDGDNNITTIERDAEGKPAIVAPFGQRTELDVDNHGWLVSIKNPAGGQHGIEHLPDGLLASYTDPNGASATYQYDSYGYLEKAIDRAGGWKTLSRADQANVSEVTITTRLGRERSYRTERLQVSGTELRTITNPAGLVITQHRDAGEMRTVTMPNGVVSIFTPTPDWRFGMSAPIQGSLIVETPGGRIFSRTMTRTGTMAGPEALIPGLLTDQTDTIVVNGRMSTIVWDHDQPVSWHGNSLGLRRSISAANRHFEEALDARGRQVGTRLGTLHPVTLAYDAHGRVEVLTQGPGGAGDRTTSFSYDPTSGRLAAITDPAGRTTTFDEYDDNGRVKEMTVPGGRLVTFAYDANGNLTSLSPPGRPAHIFRYTPLDLESEYEPPAVTGVTDPKTIYEYDFDRNLTLVTRPGGKTVDLDYEPASGRLASVTIAEGTYAYSYYPVTPSTTDPDGQLETLTAPGGQTLEFGWDGSLPTSTTWSGPVAGSVSRTFDDDFRVVTESVNGAHEVTFQYDPDSLVELVDQPSGPDLDLLRDPTAGFGAGLLSGTVQGVVETEETPSAFGELATVVATQNGSPLYTLDVSDRDVLGRIDTKSETIGGVTTTTAYTYDAAGRLDTVTVNGTTVADYAYDANGNRLHEREDLGGSAIAVYDDQDRLLSYAGTTYAYNAAGDLETKTDGAGTTTYAYDALGNLRSVVFPDGRKIEYVIDGQNRRVGKKVCPAPCTGGATPQPVQGFLYGDQLRIVAELDGSNAVVSRFVYATRPNVPDFLVKGGTTYRILSDQVGSVRLVVNATTGAVAQRIDYDAFGVVTQDTNPGFQPFGFAGGLADPDTGLVRFGARDYAPTVGRWTTKDPVDFDGDSWNLYAYVVGDPINFIDDEGYAHRKPRPSTYNRHSYGESRAKRDRGGEKGDRNRRPPRRPPKGWQGPWPPKGGIPLYYPPLFVPPWETWCRMFPWDLECQLPPPEASIPGNSCPAG